MNIFKYAQYDTWWGLQRKSFWGDTHVSKKNWRSPVRCSRGLFPDELAEWQLPQPVMRGSPFPFELRGLWVSCNPWAVGLLVHGCLYSLLPICSPVKLSEVLLFLEELLTSIWVCGQDCGWGWWICRHSELQKEAESEGPELFIARTDWFSSLHRWQWMGDLFLSHT